MSEDAKCTLELGFDNSGIEGDTLEGEPRTRCEVWTRVMGYHRPVESFNVGKQGEFEERKSFEETGKLFNSAA